jgi:hexosaminidase
MTIDFNGKAEGAESAAAFFSDLTGRPLSPHLSAGSSRFEPFAITTEGSFENVSSKAVTLGALTYQSFVWAIQTLLQLFPRPMTDSTIQWVQMCYIEDSPRFRRRSVVLDVSHRYFAPSAIVHFVKVMSMHELDILVLHVIDDVWHIELDAYP